MSLILSTKSHGYFLTLLFVLTFLSWQGCKNIKGDSMPAETIGLHPIDIRAPKFFWLIQPWKQGKLATIDGWGRYAEISFIGANRMRITPLVNFPRTQMDRKLLTWPEAGLIASTTAKMHHLAAVDDNKTKSHIPLLSWVHREMNPVLLDFQEGFVGYSYMLERNNNDTDITLFIYNYKEDKMVYESPDGHTVLMILSMDDRHALSWQRILNEIKVEDKKIFYNWRTHEVVENDLTEALNRNSVDLVIRTLRNIHPGRRYLFGYSNTIRQTVKVTWDEEYSDIKITPLNYLCPATGMNFSSFIFSTDGSWATTFVMGYRGLRNERLNKRAFFHMDERYPNGISMPIIAEDYEEYQWDYSAFVEHPVHGMCFAQEWHKGGGLYLRLYKMSEVLNEINRRLLETAEDVLDN
ncbi:MAG: hypothetical protein LBI28_13580 [Treponema sp.]|nr:hypothetical protein [Treponema sp.]